MENIMVVPKNVIFQEKKKSGVKTPVEKSMSCVLVLVTPAPAPGSNFMLVETVGGCGHCLGGGVPVEHMGSLGWVLGSRLWLEAPVRISQWVSTLYPSSNKKKNYNQK